MKLVDYDCMCVPALVGRRNLEVGVEPYQHPEPQRQDAAVAGPGPLLGPGDLRGVAGLAADPQFWNKYVESSGYDKLLFRREDLQSPITSPLYRDLMRLANSDVKELTEQLMALARAPVDQVPSLGQLVHSYAKVERLLVARQWNAAVHLLNRRGNFRDAPEHLQPLIREAYEFVCRQEAWAAFARISPEESEAVDRRVVEAWNESLFADFPPAEQERPRVAERRRVEAVDRLRHLAQQATHPPTLAQERRLIEAAGQLPAGYRHSLYDQVQRARKSVAAMERLEAATVEPVSEAAIVAAWRVVQEAHCEYLVGRERNIRVALAQQRVPLLKLLAELPEGLAPDQCDVRLLAIWQEELLSGCGGGALAFPLRSGDGAKGGAGASAHSGPAAGRGGHRAVDARAVLGRLVCRGVRIEQSISLSLNAVVDAVNEIIDALKNQGLDSWPLTLKREGRGPSSLITLALPTF